ncbi:MAG: glycosyltransferase [Bacteroidales bacterium]|nr:glycosyltransferase [Bacteroidales bacterium]
MQNSTKLSVIIPCYNAAETIRTAVGSVLSQQVMEPEIILVNDGSVDNTAAIHKQLAEKHKNIRLVDKPNGGVSSARNAGLDVATGEYIIFLDADDDWDPHLLEHLSPLLDKGDNEMVMFGFDMDRADGTERTFACRPTKHLVRDYLLGLLRSSVCAMAVKRDVVERAKIRFDEHTYYSEDREFLVRCMLEQKSVAFVDKPLLHYRYHATSAMHEPNYTVKYPTSMAAIERLYFLLQDDKDLRDAALVQLNLTTILHLKQYNRAAVRDEAVKPLLEKYAQYLRQRTRLRLNFFSGYVWVHSFVYRYCRPLFNILVK